MYRDTAKLIAWGLPCAALIAGGAIAQSRLPGDKEPAAEPMRVIHQQPERRALFCNDQAFAVGFRNIGQLALDCVEPRVVASEPQAQPHHTAAQLCLLTVAARITKPH